jgi:hypothetical protein
VIEATESGDRQLIRVTAEKLSPDNFRLLQQYLPGNDIYAAATASLFDHFVGALLQEPSYVETKRFGGLCCSAPRAVDCICVGSIAPSKSLLLN